MPACYVCDKPVARKPHKCSECRGQISKGEVYFNHHGIWDGEPERFKVCQDCETLRGELNKDRDWDDRVAFGYICEDITEGDLIDELRKFVAIKEKRGAEVKPWMKEKLNEKI